LPPLQSLSDGQRKKSVYGKERKAENPTESTDIFLKRKPGKKVFRKKIKFFVAEDSFKRIFRLQLASKTPPPGCIDQSSADSPNPPRKLLRGEIWAIHEAVQEKKSLVLKRIRVGKTLVLPTRVRARSR